MKRTILLLILCFSSFQLLGECCPTVVCVHGFMVSHRSMRSVKRFLDCGGADPYLWDYPSRKRCLKEHGYCLVQFLKEIAAARPGEPINFVTHSTGGLVLRAALSMPDCPYEAKIGRAVLLAPPNQGSSLARSFRNVYPVRLLVGNRSGRELMCYCPWDVIEQLGEYPDTLDILVVAGCRGSKLLFNKPNDGFVTVEETMLEREHYRVELYITHDQMLTNRSVLNLINTFILCGY